MRVLVTGGAGFIGSHLIENLLKEGHIVISVDDLSGGSIANLPPASPKLGKSFCNGVIDCRDVEMMDEVMRRHRPEIVFHLACNAAENKAQFSPIDITSRNWNAFINTLTPFIKYGGKRFVFTSSIAVYGTGQTPFREIQTPEPEDLYGISKYACEMALKVMSKVHGFEFVIARPHNVYGPRQNMQDPYRNVVTIFMNHRMKLQSLPIYGDGEQKRCFSYIDDVVEALYKTGFEDVAGKTFNIGSNEVHTLNELAKLITEDDGRYHHLPARVQEVKEAIADHTQAKKLLDYQDKTSLMEGIKKTWDWVREQGPQEPIYTELEIDSPLVPANWREK